MSRIDPARTGELCAVLMRAFPKASPHALARAVVAAQKAALSAKRAAEHACNYGESEATAERRYQRQLRAEVKLRDALAEACGLDGSAPSPEASCWINSPLRVQIRLGGDPRSACGWLQVFDETGALVPGDGWASGDGFPLY